jgi:enoyl-CoA hydratase
MNNLLIEDRGATRIITINRPAQLNALNTETIGELHEALKQADQDAIIKTIILTGSGEKSFVAGADIKEFAHFSVAEGRKLAARGQQLLFDFIENLRTPVIAAVNGFALGGGLELAMSCHVRIASDNARMGLPETSLGVIPGYGGTQRLAQLIGKGRAFELIFTAKMIKAEEAAQYGLVNRVVAQADLLNVCLELAAAMQKNSSVAISYAIAAVNAGFKDGVDGYQAEIEAFGDCFGTADFREGTTAFMEKRKAEFPGA